jgi:hypothetical protein
MFEEVLLHLFEHELLKHPGAVGRDVDGGGPGSDGLAASLLSLCTTNAPQAALKQTSETRSAASAICEQTALRLKSTAARSRWSEGRLAFLEVLKASCQTKEREWTWARSAETGKQGSTRVSARK